MAPDQPIAVREAGKLDLTDTEDIAKVMVASGFFKDVRQLSQAIVKVQAGRELGLGAFAAMQAFDIVEGKLRIGSGQLAAWAKAHPLRDYRVRESSSTVCRIEWFQRDTEGSEWESIGINEWTADDTKRAQLRGPAWNKYPTAMTFYRAMSNGVAMFIPDIVPTGNRVYTEADDFGPADAGYEERTGQVLEPNFPPEIVPVDAEECEVEAAVEDMEPKVPSITKKQIGMIHTLWKKLELPEEDRIPSLQHFGEGITSTKELTKKQATEMIDGLKAALPVTPAEDLPETPILPELE